jgi:hypothetical protein
MPFRLLGCCQHFGEACCVHLQGESDDAGDQTDCVGWHEGSERKGQ